MYRAGQLPCRASQLPTGTIIVYPEDRRNESVALYARVSSHDPKADMERQLIRLRDYAAANNLRVSREVSEIGRGLNGHRKRLLSILMDQSITTIVVEHRDRLARFGVEYIEAALKCSDKSLVVINETEKTDDLVQDFSDVITSLCARIYGKRSAKNRAARAIAAADEG